MAKPVVWDYSAKHGQHTWKEHCKIGSHQSPINIITKDVKYDSALEKNPLVFTQNKSINLTATNKGINISFKPTSDGNECANVTKGPLKSVYEFMECHFHWGRNFQTGCEHEIDGERFEAELHLVHKKKDLADPFSDANGLSVLGIMLKVSDDDTATNPILKSILQMLPNVSYKDKEFKSDTDFSIYKLLDGISKKFYTYDGSLTTPPLAESVKWIVFKEPLLVSRKDYDVFNQLYPIMENDESGSYHDPYERSGDCICSTKPKIGDNYRNTCDLNGRDVYASFQ